MQRRSFIRNSSVLLTAALLNSNSFANFLLQQSWKIRMFTKEIGIFTEKGGTILFMLSNEGAVVVDSQFPDSAQHLIDELKKKTEKPFRLLINTHHHADHTSGNIQFKDVVQHVLAHENATTNQQKVAKEKNNEDKQLYPDQTYSSIWCEDIGKEKICLHYFGAGHTNGDSIVHFKHANIVHMGDLVFNRKHPYVDTTAGASISNWIKILEKAKRTFNNKTQYVCGHAGDGFDVVLKASDLTAFENYLQSVLQFCATEIQAGKTKEAIIKTTSLPGDSEWKGEGLGRVLTAAYYELTGSK